MKLIPLSLYRSKTSTGKNDIYKIISLATYPKETNNKIIPQSHVVYSNVRTEQTYIKTRSEFIEEMEPYEVPSSPTKGMNLRQRIEHVGGTLNENGTITFGSIMAVDAFVRQILRDSNLASSLKIPPIPVPPKELQIAVELSGNEPIREFINQWKENIENKHEG